MSLRWHIRNIFRKNLKTLKYKIRGYLYYKNIPNEKGFSRLRSLKNELVDLRINELNIKYLKLFFGASHSSAEVVIRQYVLQKYGGEVLNAAIFSAKGRKGALETPLPPPWQQFFCLHGFSIAHWRATIVWYATITFRFAYGTTISFILGLRMLIPSSFLKRPLIKNYVYFDSLKPENLPISESEGLSYDICTFYAQWCGRYSELQNICHSMPKALESNINGINVKAVRAPYELFSSPRVVAAFLAWLGAMFLFSTYQLLKGHWWYAALFSEAARARVVRQCPTRYLAKDYLFHASGMIYRPMWTYEAEVKGCQVSRYFYSTYALPKLAAGYESQRYVFGPANWPRYIVWDKYQEALLRLNLGARLNVVVAGAIPFSDFDAPLPKIDLRSIAVFDYEPYRISSYLDISTLADYQTAFPNVHNQFLMDIYEILSMNNWQLILKTKRNIGKSGEKKYRRMINDWSQRAHTEVIDPRISAIRVMKKCSAAISFPFTSTAQLLRDQNYHSIYYDPTSWIQKDDSGAHGIKIVSGKQELTLWVKSLINIYNK